MTQKPGKTQRKSQFDPKIFFSVPRQPRSCSRKGHDLPRQPCSCSHKGHDQPRQPCSCGHKIRGKGSDDLLFFSTRWLNNKVSNILGDQCPLMALESHGCTCIHYFVFDW